MAWDSSPMVITNSKVYSITPLDPMSILSVVFGPLRWDLFKPQGNGLELISHVHYQVEGVLHHPLGPHVHPLCAFWSFEVGFI